MRRRFRLKYITRKTNGRGGFYKYYEPPGCGRVSLPADIPEDSPEFISAYVSAVETAKRTPSVRASGAGTIGALIADLKSSRAWQGLAEQTRLSRARILDKIAAKGGGALARDLRADHIYRDLRGMGPHAARNRLKVWRMLCRHGRTAGMMAGDPAAAVRLEAMPAAQSRRQWAPEHVAAFRAAHPVGSKARLALELLWWTGARRGDVVRLGWQMVARDGWLTFRQGKTGGEVSIPFTAELPAACAGLEADHAELRAALQAAEARMIFLETPAGAPHTDKGFGAYLKQQVRAAGLPDDLSAHGLRHARAAALAELGWSASRIGAWTGHRSLSEVQHYTGRADRRRMLAGTNSEQNSETGADPVSVSGEKPSKIKAL